MQVAALNLLINLADTNQARLTLTLTPNSNLYPNPNPNPDTHQAAQRALATDEAAETAYRLMCATDTL